MSEQGLLRRLAGRLTGDRWLERLAVVEDKVGSFGRAQRETLAAHTHQLESLQASVATRASAVSVRSLEQRIEALQLQARHQDRTVSEALERVGLLDGQGMDDRRFSKRMEELLRHERPVIIGPWTGEVGFELIYWIPFVRWVTQTYALPPDRLWVVSRGGTRCWYGDMAAHYVDAFEFFAPESFRTATAEARKQRREGTFDAELVKRVAGRYDLGRPDLLHPGMMYRLFMPYWKNVASIARVLEREVHTRLTPEVDRALSDLPDDYVAARFYFSDCFPDTPGNRSFVTSTVRWISRHTPVVVLNMPFAVDDHHDADLAGDQVLNVAAHMTPERNLAVQTAVIARAQAFVGTYGGYSYLAPLCGVDSLAFYSERSFKMHHLHVAQHAVSTIGGASLVPLDVTAASLFALVPGGRESTT
jgi:hypothetical protein